MYFLVLCYAALLLFVIGSGVKDIDVATRAGAPIATDCVDYLGRRPPGI
jgi:hypothetical protein